MDDEKIVINFTLPEDEGTYECRAKNYMGSASEEQIVTFAVKSTYFVKIGISVIYLHNFQIPFLVQPLYSSA